MKAPRLKSVRIKNFKAVRNSGVIKLTPVTVFIGDNGSGKSSVIEALETLQAIVEHGLDEAMHRWHGFEHVWNHLATHRLLRGDTAFHANPMAFSVRGSIGHQYLEGLTDGGSAPEHFTIDMQINIGPGFNELFIQSERVAIGKLTHAERRYPNEYYLEGDLGIRVSHGESCIRYDPLNQLITDWQFLTLIPQAMTSPIPQRRTGGKVRLMTDGANIADYLLSLRRAGQGVFDGIIETLQYVLPYARDLQPTFTSELERTVYLQLTEGEHKIPGWMLSTGTLRLLALLAVLRNPTPPPLVVIEELENGLDPRTIHLIVEEIRNAVESGRTQVIATTHSPYLLDLLSLSHIVLVERVDGQPKFTRPSDQKSLKEWAKKFSPGKLYTMEKLSAISTK